jgi:hypothetical protein
LRCESIQEIRELADQYKNKHWKMSKARKKADSSETVIDEREDVVVVFPLSSLPETIYVNLSVPLLYPCVFSSENYSLILLLISCLPFIFIPIEMKMDCKDEILNRYVLRLHLTGGGTFT